ncbi:MAG: protein kinase [Lentisphaeria bacterium]|nr:protein kinase [Lentisphaeria bacterium]
MRFVCPNCNKIVQTDILHLGKKIECEYCHTEVDVPQDHYKPGVIINDFQIEREIARGGMGIVFQARQLSLDRSVALKVLMNNFSEDTEFIKQFIQEARAAAKLNHPNVVQAYMVGEEDGILFFAMEYIDGKTMKQILAEEKKIEPLRATKIICDIAEALDFAWNEYKIVHQDIKPDNIMLTSKGRAKLADLGLAKAGDTSILDDDGDEVLGTPQYISPEQLLGEKTDVRSDLYSLGATFYHMLVGEFPYVGADANAIARKHVSEQLILPKERNPQIPARLNEIIVKLMDKDINLRYQSAAELVKDLRYVIDNFDKLNQEAKTNEASAKEKAAASTPAIPKIMKTPPAIGLKKKEADAPKTDVPKVEETKEEPKTSTPAPPKIGGAGPKIGLKKKEETPAPKAEEPKETEAKKAEEPPKAEPKKGDDKKKTADDKKTKKKPKTAPQEKKSNGAVTAIVIVLVIGLLGGAAWFKRDYIKSLLNKGDSATTESAETAKTTESTPAAPPKVVVPDKPKVVVPPKPKRTYLEDLTELKTFIAQNPNKEDEFLLRFDNFLIKYPTPMNADERDLYAEVIVSYNLIDEKLRVFPERESALRDHMRDIELRKDVIRQAEEAAAQKRLTEERIAEDNRKKAEMEAQKRAREQEVKAEEARIKAEYVAVIAPALDKMRELFWVAARDLSKKSELQQFVDKIRETYPLRDYAIRQEAEVQQDVIAFGRLLLANVDKTNSMYQVFVGNNNKFSNLQFYKGVLMAVRSTDFPNHKIRIEVLKNGKTYNYSLNKDDNREVLFKKVVENNKNLNIRDLEFYYQLFFDYDKNQLQGSAINSFWRTFLSKSL